MAFEPGNMTAMIVVSNPHLRRLLHTILSAIGFREIQATKLAKEAIQMMPTTMPDFIICANDLEDASGIRLTKAVRNAPNPRLTRIPVILFLEHPTRELVNEARSARATAIMTLPTSIKAVVAKLVAIFSRMEKAG